MGYQGWVYQQGARIFLLRKNDVQLFFKRKNSGLRLFVQKIKRGNDFSRLEIEGAKNFSIAK